MDYFEYYCGSQGCLFLTVAEFSSWVDWLVEEVEHDSGD